MNIDEVLLTQDEAEKAYEDGWQKAHTKGLTFGECCRVGDKSQQQAQCLKLLEWLEKEGLLRCDYPIKSGNRKCYRKTCKRCEIESKLKEVGK